MTFGQSPKCSKRVSFVISRKSASGRGTSKCKGPEVGRLLAFGEEPRGRSRVNEVEGSRRRETDHVGPCGPLRGP